jgi:hypothetical protein
MVGTLVHEWIRVLVSKQGEAQVRDVEELLKKQYWPPQSLNSLWWKTVFELSRWATDSCYKQVKPYLTAADVRTEFPCEGTLETPAGLLRVKGRMDLISRDRAEWKDAHGTIIDFKTGKQQVPTSARLASGEGMQFGAYLVLALTQGAQQVTLRCLSPRLISQRVLTAEHESAARQGLALVAQLQQSRCFGRSPAGSGEYKRTEALPMATLPVDADTLKRKREASSTGPEVQA